MGARYGVRPVYGSVGTDCMPSSRRFNSCSSHNSMVLLSAADVCGRASAAYGEIEQLVARKVHGLEVAGSNPVLAEPPTSI